MRCFLYGAAGVCVVLILMGFGAILIGTRQGLNHEDALRRTALGEDKYEERK
jgi:hypothetical protein